QYIMFPLWSSISSSNKCSDEIDEDDTADDTASENPVQKPATKDQQTLKNILDKIKTTEFNWHEIDFERHDIQLSLLVIVVVIFGVGVTVVVVAAGVVVPLGYVNGFLQSLRFRGSNISFNASSQIVKFFFYFSDFNLRIILVRHKPFELSPGDLIGLFYSHSSFKPADKANCSFRTIVAACVSRAVVTLLATSFLMEALVMAGASDVDVLLGGILSTKDNT
ncbi:hypothetical protein Tco_0828706, partial [Tanacetum coccineum]